MPKIKKSSFEPVIEVLAGFAELIGAGCIYKRGERMLPEFQMPLNYGIHDYAFCRRVKCRNERLCLHNDFQLLPRMLDGNDRSFLHRCHAGAVEMVVPIYDTDGESLRGVVIIGPFRPDENARPVYPETSREFYALPLQDEKKLLVSAGLLAALLPPRLAAARPIPRGLTPKQPRDPRLLDALEYISRNFSRRMELADAAAVARLSPSRFSHIFAAECGIDFSAYLLRLRLYEAELLLRRTEMTVGSIADATGFSSISHFSAAFLRTYGRTPRAFRALTRENAEKSCS